MRAYVLTAGAAFLLLFLAHVARILAEGTSPLGQPIFLITSALSLVMVAWAATLMRRP